MKPRVLVTRRLPVVSLSHLESVCEVDLYTKNEAMSPDELKRRVHGKDGLVCLMTDQVDCAVIKAGSNLQIIANVAVGHDNIDIPCARSRGVIVTNTPDVLTEAVADLTLGLMLTISRRIVEGDRLVRSGSWAGWSLNFMLGMELRGKQCGIIGAGRIGRAVALRASSFGMRVVFARHGKCKSNHSVQALNTSDNDTWISLDKLLETSDVVSLHVPLIEQTKHLINRQALMRMKQTAYLINVSRGSVVDEEALAWALNSKLIAGAALDVYEREPSVHPDLLGLETVVLSPHLGSGTRETRRAMADLAVANTISVLSGKPPLTPITP